MIVAKMMAMVMVMVIMVMVVLIISVLLFCIVGLHTWNLFLIITGAVVCYCSIEFSTRYMHNAIDNVPIYIYINQRKSLGRFEKGQVGFENAMVGHRIGPFVLLVFLRRRIGPIACCVCVCGCFEIAPVNLF